MVNSENLDMAMEDVKSLLALTEDEQHIMNALLLGGMIYEKQGETALALSAFSTALHIDEFYVPALFQRGQIYFQQDDWLRAFSDLMLVLEIAENQEIWQTTINILMGVYPEGTTYEEASVASQEFYNQAMSSKDSGDYQSSADALSKAIEIDPLNDEFYYQRGLDLANLGEMDPAITDMSYKIALDPFDPAGYLYRGLIESDYGMVSEAIADLEKALEFDITSQAEDIATQALESLRQRLETCRMTEFEVVNDEESPTFLFTFIGPPNTDFLIFTAPVTGSSDGTIDTLFLPPTPEDGVTTTVSQYRLRAGETAPIELKIEIAMPGCNISKVATWPAVDIIALLSGN
jgi:tetratricopeptide (TPR) repeat protein